MAEEKTYVFGEGAGNGILGLLGPMLSQRGVDPNVLLAMQGRNNDGLPMTRFYADCIGKGTPIMWEDMI